MDIVSEVSMPRIGDSYYMPYYKDQPYVFGKLIKQPYLVFLKQNIDISYELKDEKGAIVIKIPKGEGTLLCFVQEGTYSLVSSDGTEQQFVVLDA